MSCSQDEINKQVQAKVQATIAEKIKNSEKMIFYCVFFVKNKKK